MMPWISTEQWIGLGLLSLAFIYLNGLEEGRSIALENPWENGELLTKQVKKKLTELVIEEKILIF